MSYHDLLDRRKARAALDGRVIEPDEIHPMLHPFQRDIVQWAVAGARRAVWADTGLGKTFMQLEWCRLSADTALIVAPLGVTDQTVEEAVKLGLTVRYIRNSDAVDGPGIYITNYEMVEHFDPALFGAIALDEASILKNSTGKTRTMLIEHFQNVPNRTAWTATPGPNDPEELTNQSEFLGQMSRTNMLAAYFIHDQDGWRMKGHAAQPMIEWMSSWAVAIRRPSDLGYDDTGYDLPGLEIIPELVETFIEPEAGELFAASLGGTTGRAKVRKQSLQDRVDRCVELINAEPDEPWLIWCGLNDEADAITRAIPGAVNVQGSMEPEDKVTALRGFAHGDVQVLVTKPKIAGMGLNFQRAARMAFVGLSDSYESYYQCIRREYRYGQKRVVKAHIILSSIEQQISGNVARKEKQANRVIDGMIETRRRNHQ